MIQTIREHVTIKPGGMIEIHRPDLPAGTEAEIIIIVEQPEAAMPPLVSFVGKGKGCFTSAGEVGAFIRAERDGWER